MNTVIPDHPVAVRPLFQQFTEAQKRIAVVTESFVERAPTEMEKRAKKFKAEKEMIRRLNELNSSRCVSAEMAADCPLYFPLKLDPSEVPKIMRCLAFKLEWEPDTVYYVVKSADCPVTKGEGEDLGAALNDFVEAVQCIISEGTGGLFPGMSSQKFQEQAFASLIDGWKADNVNVVEKSHYQVEIV